MDERYKRTAMLFGDDAMKRIQAAHVTIVGLGGVGATAAESLVRSGVRRLRLVDFDIVRESNFNRQLFATTSFLGRPKVEAALARLTDIDPACAIDCRNEFFHRETAEAILASTDVLIDAIDSVTPKIVLLSEAHARRIPVVSSMGAAGKRDTSLVKCGDIADTEICPLARRIRKKLRQQGISGGIRCVYSTEAPVIPDVDEDEDEHYERGRKRSPLPSAGYIVGIFGHMVAAEVLSVIMTQK